VTLDFLREHKIAIALNLATSGSWSDKKLLLSSLKNAVAMRGQSLPEEFKNEISLLAVDEGFQGRGLGALLVNELRRLVDTEIHVKTDSTNTGAIRFYEKNKFVKSQTLRIATRELVCFKSE
jgi:ribosomal protein S18 acetylase RimI-like enzyme